MKRGYIKDFKPSQIVIDSVTAQKRGFILGDRVRLELTGHIRFISDDKYLFIAPDYEGKYIKVGYERLHDKKTSRQGRFFFAFLGDPSILKQLHDQGYYSVDDLYPALKVYLQKIRPLWKLFESQDNFSIKEIGKDEEFSELINYTEMYLTQVMGVDTSQFWKEYESEYRDMGYQKTA